MNRIFVLLLLSIPAAAAVPTFNRDIAPILYRNCAECHRPGEVAPFSLLTYEDAAKRAKLIATVTGSRYMPPWKAEPAHRKFKDERRLTDEQIALIREWAGHGAPEGNAAEKPAPPKFASGWMAGQPDEVLKTAEQSFPIPADGPDLFQCFVVPLYLEYDHYVKTMEFHPGNRRVVHHALVFVDTTGEARQLDAATPEPGYPCFGGPRVLVSGGLGGWAPGATPQPLPAGVAQTLEKGSDLIVQIHYHPSGKPETDRSSLGLAYTSRPEKGLAGMIAGSRAIDLAPGDAHAVVKDEITIPRDVDLIGITPHAHWLCKDMHVVAHLPDGTVEPLIRIKDWDFNWQGQYRYASPVRLPRGTRVEMTYVYDNSAANPRNPSSPPKRVQYGEQTTDEMAVLFLQVVLPRPEDVPGFRREIVLSRIESVIDNRDPVGLSRLTIQRIRAAKNIFDRNHDGNLDPDERKSMLDYMAAHIR